MSSIEVNSYSPFPPLQSPPRRRESPAKPRPKSRYEFVKAHRYSTQAPFLAILPVQMSLTDGTSIPPPSRIGLPTPPQTPTREEAPSTPQSIDTRSIFGSFAGPLSSHPITPSDTSDDNSLQRLFIRPESAYSNIATFGRPSTTYDDFRDTGLITPPPSGNFHKHRPSVISRFFGRRSTRSSTSSSSPTSPVSEASFSRYPSSSSGFSSPGHYHPNGGTCAFCSDSSPSFMPRSVKRTTSTYSFQTSLKRNTTIYAGEVMSPPDFSSQQKSNTFPRMVRKKSMDMLKRKSAGWFRDLEAEQAEEEARLRASVAHREKEREMEMRLQRERKERRMEFEEEDDDDDAATVVNLEPPPMLPELDIIRESSLEEGVLEDLFNEIGKDV